MLWDQAGDKAMPRPKRLPTIRELPIHVVDTSYRVIDSGTAVYHDFVSFIGRDNVIEVAVALIIGASFTAVSTSLVSDILTPLLSLVPFLDRTLVNKFIVLRCGRASTQPVMTGDGGNAPQCEYHTLAEAIHDGANTLSYGRFLEISLQFLFSACSLYLLIKFIQILWHKPIVKETEICRYCRRNNSKRATRCGSCTSWLDGREDNQNSDHWTGINQLAGSFFCAGPSDGNDGKGRAH